MKIETEEDFLCIKIQKGREMEDQKRMGGFLIFTPSSSSFRYAHKTTEKKSTVLVLVS